MTHGPAPLISVVIPAYNSARTLRAAVDSVLNQDWPSIELIVVDDGSKDATCAVVAPDAQAGRLQLLQQVRNQGVSAARNRGISAATGDFIAFLDSDDVWTGQHLSQAMDVLSRHGDVDVVIMNSAVIDLDTGVPHGTWMDLRREAFDATTHTDLGQGCQRIDGRFIEAVITGCFVHVQALVARRAVFAQLRFDETLRCSEDLDWAIRTVHEGKFTWAWSESVTGSYRLHPDSLAAQTPEKQEFIEKIGLNLFSGYLRWPGLDDRTRNAIRRTLINSCMDLIYFARQKGKVSEAWQHWLFSLRHGCSARQLKEFPKLLALSVGVRG